MSLSGVPDPPQICSLINHTSSEVLVTCIPGYAGGEGLDFEVEHTGPFVKPGIAESHWEEDGSNATVTVHDLHPSTQYVLKIYQKNKHGRSSAAFAINVNTTGEKIIYCLL